MRTIPAGCLLFPLMAQVSWAAIFTVTGYEDPGLVVFDEEQLGQIAGSHQNVIIGHHLAFDQSGRLFANSAGIFREFDPYNLQVIAESGPIMFVSGIAAGNGAIYSLTGSDSPALVRFDSDTFIQNGGTLQTTISFPQHLAFDNTGRLFALTRDHLIEFDPVSLGILRQTERSPFLAGLAARDGILYSFTGLDTPGLVTFDADTLLQTAGTLQDSIFGGYELAFDADGRLFGSSKDHLLEMDPDTLGIVNQTELPAFQSGFAVGIPEPTGAALFSLGMIFLGFKRSRELPHGHHREQGS